MFIVHVFHDSCGKKVKHEAHKASDMCNTWHGAGSAGENINMNHVGMRGASRFFSISNDQNRE
jgi:hypothetical protein